MTTTNGEELLRKLVSLDGSDLHLAADAPPAVRIHGRLDPLPGYGPQTAEDINNMIRQMVGEQDYLVLSKTGELDRAITLEGGYRLRINAYRQQGTNAVALRLLPNAFFSFESLGIPCQVLETICGLHAGLVLVTGATSSGKSTTIASMVDRINSERPCHILTIEDPVEYRHAGKAAFVSQREVGRDTASFAEALRRAMREDPDVIVIGEMRDLETMSAALTLAETGHLTFATLHTSSAVQTISRIISAYPSSQQMQARIQLATCLQYVICQKLIPRDDGCGRALASEILVITPAVRAMIREEKTHHVKTAMQTGTNLGMQTLNKSLLDLVERGHISLKTAIHYSEEKSEIQLDVPLPAGGCAGRNDNNNYSPPAKGDNNKPQAGLKTEAHLKGA